MKTRTLIGALLAAGVIGGGVGAAIEPITHANAAQTTVTRPSKRFTEPSGTRVTRGLRRREAEWPSLRRRGR